MDGDAAVFVQQRTDTVFVVVPQAVDSLTVRVVGVADTVRAVVQQTGGEWYFIATLVLTAALVGVTIWAHLRMHALEKRSTGVQEDHTKLQRQFNEMQAQHEVERREAESKREGEHRRAVDARISALAYAVRRQLRSWLDEAPDEMKALMSVVDDWNADVKQLQGKDAGEAPALTHGMLEVTVNWASRRSGEHSDRAEERMLQLVVAAPDASPQVAESIRAAYVLFYKATGRMNRQVAIRRANGEPSANELTAAYHELETCTQALEPAIGEELRGAWGRALA